MNKCASIAAAVALLAATATPVAAVTLNPRGLGQVLLYPYYTVNKNQDTLLSVVNTSDAGKVMSVNVLEGYNGRFVLKFVLFLSAHDVWTAAISQTADGAKISTPDHSCTYPTIPAAGQPLSAAAYTGASIAPFNVPDSGPQTLARTREGHIEIAAIGDVVAGSATDHLITHVQNGSPGGGLPPGCSALLANGIPPDGDMVTPTNGLGGSASIVNVGEGTFFAYNADALSGFTSELLLVAGGGIALDYLRHANSANSPTGTAIANVSTNSGALLALNYIKSIDAVSAVFMADSLYNEYLVGSGLGANTDWIVTFPTKRFYVDSQVYAPTPRAPFVETFHDGHSNVTLEGDFYDQEELHAATHPPADGCGVLCPDNHPFVLPREVNAVSFLRNAGPSTPSGVFGSQLATAFGPLYANQVYGDAGWLKLGLDASTEPHTLPGGTTADGQHITLHGLPVAGFMVYNIINTNAAPNRLANYGGTYAHRSTVSCSHDETPTTEDPCS